jgi:heme/copper-type cytochrome/quinol oxidase subunit 2
MVLHSNKENNMGTNTTTESTVTVATTVIVRFVIFPSQDYITRIENLYGTINVTVSTRGAGAQVFAWSGTPTEWDELLRNYCVDYAKQLVESADDLSA